jgi:hypothetical protein
LGKPEGMRSLRKHGRRWEDNIRRDRREIEWRHMDSIYLAQERDQWRALVNTVTNLRVPKNIVIFLNCCANGGFSRRAQLYGVS